MPELPLPDPPLGDDLVALRPWERADVPWVVEGCRDPLVARFTTVPEPYGEADALDFFARQPAWRAAGEGLHLAVVGAADGAGLGAVGLQRFDWANGRGEIGYWVAPVARRRGVATRATLLVARWAFAELGLARVELLPFVDNTASQAVAEAAGFTREGVLRSFWEIKGRRRDMVTYSLLPGDPGPWAPPRARRGPTDGRIAPLSRPST